MFHGSMVALVTPMTPKGELDESALEALIRWHLAEGTDAIVLLGTTGECATVSEEERIRMIKMALNLCKGKVPIIVGTGSNCTRDAIYKTQQAMDLGADACLVVTPYFNKPTQEGLYQHFRSIAETVAIPIILYNVSSRTACDMLPETVERLSSISNIVGIKEASSDLSRGKELLQRCKDNIDLYSGDDASALAFMLQGGKGVISVTANLVPKMMHEMCEAALHKNLKVSGELNTKLMPLHKNLFLESNPIPVKWALSEMGKISPFIRLPLTSLSTEAQKTLKEAMQTSGVLK